MRKLNRRHFIKTAIAAAASVMAPVRLSAAYPDFDPEETYSCLFKYIDKGNDLYGDEIPSDLLKKADQWISATIPEQFRGDVERKHLPPSHRDKSDPLGQRGYYGLKRKGYRELAKIDERNGGPPARVKSHFESALPFHVFHDLGAIA